MAKRATARSDRSAPAIEQALKLHQAGQFGEAGKAYAAILAADPRHFAALRQLMPSISQKVLTEQLRELIADDIVHRDQTGPVPAPVIYSLTDYGKTALPMLEMVRIWGARHIERREADGPCNGRTPQSCQGATPELRP